MRVVTGLCAVPIISSTVPAQPIAKLLNTSFLASAEAAVTTKFTFAANNKVYDMQEYQIGNTEVTAENNAAQEMLANKKSDTMEYAKLPYAEDLNNFSGIKYLKKGTQYVIDAGKYSDLVIDSENVSYTGNISQFVNESGNKAFTVCLDDGTLRYANGSKRGAGEDCLCLWYSGDSTRYFEDAMNNAKPGTAWAAYVEDGVIHFTLKSVSEDDDLDYSSDEVDTGLYAAKRTIKAEGYDDVVLYDTFTIEKAPLTVDFHGFWVGDINTVGINGDAATAKAAALKRAAVAARVSGISSNENEETQYAIEDAVINALTLVADDDDWTSTKGYSYKNPAEIADDTERYFLKVGEYDVELTETPTFDNYYVQLPENTKATVEKIPAEYIEYRGLSASALNGLIYNGFEQKLKLVVDGFARSGVAYPYIEASDYAVKLYKNDTLVSTIENSAETGCPTYNVAFTEAGAYKLVFEPTKNSENIGGEAYDLANFTVGLQNMTQVIADTQKPDDEDTSKITWTLSKPWTGKPQTMSIESFSYHDIPLTEGKDYTLTCEPQTDIGDNYSFTIAGVEGSNFEGSYTGTWAITSVQPESVKDDITFNAADKEFDTQAYGTSDIALSAKEGSLAEDLLNDANTSKAYTYHNYKIENEKYCGTTLKNGHLLNIGVNYKADDYDRNRIEFSGENNSVNFPFYKDSQCTRPYGSLAEIEALKINPDNTVTIKMFNTGKIMTLYIKPGTSFAVKDIGDKPSSPITLVAEDSIDEIAAFLNATKLDSTPTNAGDYLAVCTLTNPKFEKVVLYDTFEIKKKPVTLTMKYNTSTYSVRTNGDLAMDFDKVEGEFSNYRVNRYNLVNIKNGEDILENNAFAPVGSYTYVIDEAAAASGNNANFEFGFANDGIEISGYNVNEISNLLTYAESTNRYAYDKTAKALDFTLTNTRTGELVKDTDYTVDYYLGETKVEAPTDAGVYTVKITGKEGSNYTGTLTKTLTIDGIELTNNDVTLNSDNVMVYTGSDIKPTVTVKVGSDETPLTEGTDYIVTYYVVTGETRTEITEIKNMAIYNVEVTGKGNYSGTITKIFLVTQADPTVTVTPGNIVYDGAAVDASDFAVTSDSTGDVTLTYYSDAEGQSEIEAPKDAGTYYVKATVKKTNNYNAASSALTEFSIAKKEVKLTLRTEAITWGELLSYNDLCTAEGVVDGDKIDLTGMFEVWADNGSVALERYNFTDASQNGLGEWKIRPNFGVINNADGNYTFNVVNYIGASTFNINKLPITNDRVDLIVETPVYQNVNYQSGVFYFDGELKKPTLNVKVAYERLDNGKVENAYLSDTGWATVKGQKAATDPGDYTLKVTGTDNLTGDTEVAWSIKKGIMYLVQDEVFANEPELNKVYDGKADDFKALIPDTCVPRDLATGNAVNATLNPEIAVNYFKYDDEQNKYLPFDGIPTDVGKYKLVVSATADNYEFAEDAGIYDRYYSIDPAKLLVTTNGEELEKAEGYSAFEAHITVTGWVNGESYDLPETVTIPAGLKDGDVIPDSVFDPLREALAAQTGNYEIWFDRKQTILLHKPALAKVEAETAYIKDNKWIDVDAYLTVYDENGTEIPMDDEFYGKYYIDGADSANKPGTYEVIIRDKATDEALAQCKWKVVSIILGDVNFDNVVDDADAALVLKYISANKPFSENADENARAIAAANADEKGEVDMLDVITIMQIAEDNKA